LVFRAVDLTIPAEWEGETVHFIWDSESEAAVWADGMPVQAFNGARGDDRRTDYVLSTSVPKGGQSMSFYVEMVCCGMFGNAGPAGFLAPPDNKKSFTLKIAEIAVMDKEAWDLFYDLNTIIDIAKELPDTDNRGWLAVEAARTIVNACHTDNHSTWAHVRLSCEFPSYQAAF
jgi:alpha-mannosidase